GPKRSRVRNDDLSARHGTPEFVVNDCIAYCHHSVAGEQDPPVQVDVLCEHEVGVVEAPDLPEYRGPDGEGEPGDIEDILVAVRIGSPCNGIVDRGPEQVAEDADLNVPVEEVDHLATGDRNAWIGVERGEEPFEPTGVHLG